MRTIRTSSVITDNELTDYFFSIKDNEAAGADATSLLHQTLITFGLTHTAGLVPETDTTAATSDMKDDVLRMFNAEPSMLHQQSTEYSAELEMKMDLGLQLSEKLLPVERAILGEDVSSLQSTIAVDETSLDHLPDLSFMLSRILVLPQR